MLFFYVEERDRQREKRERDCIKKKHQKDKRYFTARKYLSNCSKLFY